MEPDMEFSHRPENIERTMAYEAEQERLDKLSRRVLIALGIAVVVVCYLGARLAVSMIY